MRHLKFAILPVLFTAGLILLPVTDAAAHERGYHYFAHSPERAHIADRYVRLPRWLRYNYDFVRWYRFNHYRFRPHVTNWRRVHRHYQRDYAYHRQLKKRYGPHKRKRIKKQKRHRHGRRDHYSR